MVLVQCQGTAAVLGYIDVPWLTSEVVCVGCTMVLIATGTARSTLKSRDLLGVLQQGVGGTPPNPLIRSGAWRRGCSIDDAVYAFFQASFCGAGEVPPRFDHLVVLACPLGAERYPLL